MILIITAHDLPTRDNLEVASVLVPNAAVALLRDQAVRAEIVPALNSAPDAPLLIFSHGKTDHLIGHDSQMSISVSDHRYLQSRSSFAYACNTAAILGPAVAAAGGTWFGFAGPVNCLPADIDVRQHFQQVVQFIATTFPNCSTQRAASQFVADLDAIANRILAIFDENPDTPLEHYHALRDLTRRLRISLHNVAEHVRHPEAIEVPLF